MRNAGNMGTATKHAKPGIHTKLFSPMIVKLYFYFS